jgi:hypothetical protein
MEKQVIGKNVEKIDALALATGQPVYADDIKTSKYASHKIPLFTSRKCNY